ncbi:N-acetylmuramoyl-L-alanine amidase [Rhodococcus sp. HNM0569]|uniref:N-acetylmuramoyl-L-alanine amidase n=1 Tax=Rhodococcus sp. HNM0569 TaxID=2716340 RepID=UPI00146CBC9D|nr:N-acetylmuramoyl-L-alanine amidase [Rhodococcus sp. HNM0569]NLU82569.1 N-acetylmuramoyl-L-alanine amidase [Rhodococcus sp. HNM0569]
MSRNVLKASVCAVALGAAVLTPTQAAAEPEQPTGNELAGRTVFLDPGHQGSADGHDLAKQVPDGRGGTKDCQTTGMTTLGGVPEHTIAWNVSQLVKSALEGLGAKVELSRPDDTGWGGCIDERAAAANASGADLAVSIHADSTAAAEDADKSGFHMIVPQLPLPDAAADKAQAGVGLEASKAMRDAYVSRGFTPANYAGVTDGLQTRADIAGPARTHVPLVFVEMGNGANPADAAKLESNEGQLDHAVAIITGAVTQLLGAPAPDAAPQATTPAPAGDAAPAPDQSTPTAPDLLGDEDSPSTAVEAIVAQALTILTQMLESGGLSGLQDLMNDETMGLASDLAATLLSTLQENAG